MVGYASGDRSPLWLLPKWFQDRVLPKPQHTEAAKEILKYTAIVISTKGESYLGGVVGSFRQLVERKVKFWTNEAQQICRNSATCGICRLQSRTFFEVEVLSAGNQVGRKQTQYFGTSGGKIIQSCFIPALTGQGKVHESY